MAQSGYTPISIYYSTTASASPTAGNLVNGELAINITDGKLFYKDNAGVVQVIAGKGGAGVAGGSNTQVQYNSSGSLAGSANMTFNGTTLTLANDASISGLTVGKGTGAVSTNTALGVSALNANTSGAYNLAAGYQASYYNTTGSNNVSLGLQAAYNTTTGSNNIAIGVSALNSNTTASSNTAVGYQAGYVSTGDQNTYIGQRAGYTQTSGTLNTYVGYNAANGNSGANSYNTGIGAFCFSNLSTGANNVAIGYQSLQANTTANANVAIGRQAMYSNTTGAENTAVGDVSFYYNTTGGSNVALGRYSLYNNTTANNNIAIGYQAGYTNTTATRNTLMGYQAGYSSNSNDCTFVGYQAGYSTNIYGANTYVGSSAGYAGSTGASYNVAVGYNALTTNSSGGNNTAIGTEALKSNTSAANNTAVGYQAGYSNTTGYSGVSIGYQAGYTNTTGPLNVIVGYQAGYSTTGGNNTFIGTSAGYAVSSGAKNTIIGQYNGNQGGLDIRTASNYIVLSDGDGNPRGYFNNLGTFNIGGNMTFVPNATYGQITITGSQTTNTYTTLEVYSSGASNYRFYVGFGGTVYATSTTITGISDQRVKENIVDLPDGLNAVMALKPRKFDWKEGKGKDIKGDRGFIAQEFETVFPDMIEEWKDPAPEGEEPYKAVNANLIPVLVKAIQELKAEVDSLKQQLAK